jgi:hypothetical protein
MFIAGLALEALGIPTFRGPWAWSLVFTLVISLGFPISLAMMATRLQKDRLAMSAALIAVVTWLTYDLSNLDRLLPLSMTWSTMAGVHAFIQVGWWLRNVEVVLSVLVLDRVGGLFGWRLPRGLVLALVSNVGTKILFLYLAQTAPSEAVANLSKFAAIAQRAVTLAAGGLTLWRLSVPTER